MDTKGLGQNALVSGSIICQIVKRHLTAHIASAKDQLLKELCYGICYLFKLLELNLYLSTEAAFCRVLQRMTGMEMD